MEFGVVIPAFIRNAEDSISLNCCLKALLHCQPAPTQIVVVDDGSPMEIRLPEGAEGRVTLIHQNNSGPASARNKGATSVTAEILVFVDADIVVPPDTFARLAEGFHVSTVAAIWGTVSAMHPHRGIVSRYKNLSHRHFTLLQPEYTRHLTSMLVAFRPAVFWSVGGFDTRWRSVSVEDVELGRSLYVAGHTVKIDKELAAEHRHRFTMARAIRNDFHKARRHAATTVMRRRQQDSSVKLEGPGERRQLHYLMGLPLGVGAAGAFLMGRPATGALLTGLLVAWERDFWNFLRENEGNTFAIACIPWMVIERVVVATAVGWGAWEGLQVKEPK